MTHKFVSKIRSVNVAFSVSLSLNAHINVLGHGIWTRGYWSSLDFQPGESTSACASDDMPMPPVTDNRLIFVSFVVSNTGFMKILLLKYIHIFLSKDLSMQQMMLRLKIDYLHMDGRFAWVSLGYCSWWRLWCTQNHCLVELLFGVLTEFKTTTWMIYSLLCIFNLGCFASTARRIQTINWSSSLETPWGCPVNLMIREISLLLLRVGATPGRGNMKENTTEVLQQHHTFPDHTNPISWIQLNF